MLSVGFCPFVFSGSVVFVCGGFLCGGGSVGVWFLVSLFLGVVCVSLVLVLFGFSVCLVLSGFVSFCCVLRLSVFVSLFVFLGPGFVFLSCVGSVCVCFLFLVWCLFLGFVSVLVCVAVLVLVLFGFCFVLVCFCWCLGSCGCFWFVCLCCCFWVFCPFVRVSGTARSLRSLCL